MTRPPIVRVCPAIRQIRAEDWDACAGGHDPFTRHAFLLALEASGSAASAFRSSSSRKRNGKSVSPISGRAKVGSTPTSERSWRIKSIVCTRGRIS
ncbi:MAG: peptidogalycan biosysnthesis protein [Bdellovibrionota bacterium]